MPGTAVPLLVAGSDEAVEISDVLELVELVVSEEEGGALGFTSV